MQQLLRQCASRLTELGIEVTIDGEESIGVELWRGTARVRRGKSTASYSAIWGPHIKLHEIGGRHEPSPTLVLTSFVAPRTAEGLRTAGAQYVDAQGNAWLEFGDVHIDVRGRRRPQSDVPLQARATRDLFSASRSQVVMALLAWPFLWKAPQRELAQAAGVSLGQVHNTLRLLDDTGFADRQRSDLLDLWAAGFPTGLGRRITLAFFHSEGKGAVKKVHPDDAIFVSGGRATPEVLRPARLLIYVDRLQPQLAVLNRWRSDGEPNVTVRRKFWTAPQQAAHDYDGPLVGVRPAPWPLVYADLLTSDDPRERAAAREWKERFARLG